MSRVWDMPALLGGLSAFGLAAALLGDGPWDAVAWVTLGLPVAVMARHLLWRRRAPQRRVATR